MWMLLEQDPLCTSPNEESGLFGQQRPSHKVSQERRSYCGRRRLEGGSAIEVWQALTTLLCRGSSADSLHECALSLFQQHLVDLLAVADKSLLDDADADGARKSDG